MNLKNQIKFNPLSIEDGLSESVVYCILQDSYGFMWFGTQDGLNRYDGNKFSVYKNDNEKADSICDNEVRCLIEDKYKNIWIGTENGLSKYDREKDCFMNFKSDINIPHSLPKNEIRKIIEDGAGNLWIGTYGGGLVFYDVADNLFFTCTGNGDDVSNLRDKRIIDIVKDRNENLVIGTWGGGVNLYDIKSKKFIHFTLTDDEESNISNMRVNAVYRDRENVLWAATNNGLYSKENETSAFIHYKHDTLKPSSISSDLVSSIFEDSSGNLWIGTREKGLNLFIRQSEEFICYEHKKGDPTSLCNNSVYTIYEDRSGIVWIGTFGGGVCKFNNTSKKFEHYFYDEKNTNSLLSNIIYSFCEDDEGNFWIGTRDTGLSKFDRKKNKFDNFVVHSDEDVNGQFAISAILKGKENNLWIGSLGGGLNKFDLTTKKFSHIKNTNAEKNSVVYDSVYSLAIDNSGIIWIGTGGGGLNIYDPVKNEFTIFTYDPDDEHSISSNRVRTIFIDSDEIIWAGTDKGGLNKFNKETKKFDCYKNSPDDPFSISNNNILSVCEDRNGILWIGTMSGLNRFDKEKGIFKRYRKKDGLSNDMINGILEDNKGYLWISTNEGISKFDCINEKFKNYDIRDGLQANEFNIWAYYKLKSGELAFGGVNGFNIFNPDEINDNLFVPPVVISDFRIFNKPVAIGEKDSPLKKSITVQEEIVLSYSDSVFSFEFAALDYSIPGKNQYAYLMEGFDKEWVYSGNRRFATYTNLNPGEYTFRIRGSNNDGIWNEEGKSLKIIITPPFWKTWWFRTLSVMAVAGTGAGIYQNKLNQIRKEKKAQEEFTKRLIDVQESDKKRISLDLHDSIGQNLLITKNKLLMSLKKPEDNEYLLNNINEVSEIISSTLKDVREISYTLHPYQIERLGFSKAIKSILDTVSKSTEIKFASNIDDIDKLLPKDVELSVYRIVQECINNIVKHSKAKEVILNINKSSEDLSILISDDGNGFNLDKVKANPEKHGFGLSGMAERIKLFKGKFNIESSAGIGTTINISVPYEAGY